MGSGDLNNFSVRESSITWGVGMQHRCKVDKEGRSMADGGVPIKQLLPMPFSFFLFFLSFFFFFCFSFILYTFRLTSLGCWCLALIIRPVGSPPQHEFRLRAHHRGFLFGFSSHRRNKDRPPSSRCNFSRSAVAI